MAAAPVPDNLLDDLDDLDSDGEGHLDEDEGDLGEDVPDAGGAVAVAGAKRARPEGGVSAAELDALSDEEEGDDLAAVAARASGLELPADAELESQLSRLRGRAGGFRSVAHLRETARFKDHMARVVASMAAGVTAGAAGVGHLEDHPDYRLVVASNQARGGGGRPAPPRAAFLTRPARR